MTQRGSRTKCERALGQRRSDDVAPDESDRIRSVNTYQAQWASLHRHTHTRTHVSLEIDRYPRARHERVWRAERAYVPFSPYLTRLASICSSVKPCSMSDYERHRGGGGEGGRERRRAHAQECVVSVESSGSSSSSDCLRLAHTARARIACVCVACTAGAHTFSFLISSASGRLWAFKPL